VDAGVIATCKADTGLSRGSSELISSSRALFEDSLPSQEHSYISSSESRLETFSGDHGKPIVPQDLNHQMSFGKEKGC
jgi:hypothetical protein